MSHGPIHWAGSRALLIERASLDTVLALHAHLKNHPLPGQIDLVPAAKTLLVKCDSHRNAARAHAQIPDIAPPPINRTGGRTVEIEVVYDGEDLAAVGKLTGLGADGIIKAHTQQRWRAAFGGFAPGFVYLVAENEWPDVPRRDSPRTAVPAGSVALAGQFSAIYPNRSPGGWQLIGRTNARVWDTTREAPALIQPGDLVRYKAVDQLQEEPDTQAGKTCATPASAEYALEVIGTGLQSLVEDMGRPSLSHLGLSAAGVADETAARQSNRLVGNTAGSAVIETLASGLAIRARGDLVLACTGAEATAQIEGTHGLRMAPPRTPFALHDGETLTLTAAERGLRSYLAVRGGINVPAVLGSRSTDTLSGTGPAPLAAGAVLPVGTAGPSHVVGAAEPTTLSEPEDDAVVLRVTLGPRDDWFSPATRARLTRQRWLATHQSNRIGIRLTVDENDGEAGPLKRCRDGELASEGTVPGAVQVPPSGLPMLFLKDHPVTGGYPVIAVVIAEDLPIAAQIAPGETLRFTVVAPDTLRPVGNDAESARPFGGKATP